jgi:PadR family transcriptional regulator, regulatory protein PadR
VPRETGELLQGTLGMLILKALAARERHGYGIARWIQEITGSILQIEEGSLYPALRRLEERGYVESAWGMTDLGRRARFYALTARGRQHLQQDASSWMRFAEAVTLVLRADPAVV